MLHVKKQARKSQALYNLVNFDMVEKFVEDPEKEYGKCSRSLCVFFRSSKQRLHSPPH